MDQRRFVLFIVSAVGILIANLWLQSVLRKPLPPQPVAQQNANDKGAEKPGEKNGDNAIAAKPPEEAAKAGQPDGQAPAVAEVPEPAPQWFTLGSADPDDTKNSYRLMATFTNVGAAVERIEMASARYRDMEDRSGYLGHLAATDAENGPKGAKVNVVGEGTPAQNTGLKPGDVITKCDSTDVDSAQTLVDALNATRPEQKIELTVLRDGQPQPPMSVTLGRRPLEVVRPEAFTAKMEIPRPLDVVADNEHDPFSFLLTMWQVGDAKLPEDKKLAEGQKPDFEPPASLNAELEGVKLRSARWEGKQVGDTVEFTRALPKFGLEIVKRYKIAKVDGDKPDQQPYHLTLEVELRNVGKEPQKVAYQLDGPTGLPTEGWWYATRISREWSGAGVRDMAMLLQNAATGPGQPDGIFGGKLRRRFAGRSRCAVGVRRCRCPIFCSRAAARAAERSPAVAGANQTHSGRPNAGRSSDFEPWATFPAA